MNIRIAVCVREVSFCWHRLILGKTKLCQHPKKDELPVLPARTEGLHGC